MFIKYKIKSIIMADLENKFEKPTKDNVEKGDFMVIIRSGVPGLAPGATYGLAEITNITEERIEGKYKDDSKSVRYRDAIVVKKDGKGLVGGFIQDYCMYPKSSD